MASIVLGIGCSHTPQLHTPVAQWEIRARRDMAGDIPLWFHGERLDYEEIEQRRRHDNIAAQTAMAVREDRQRRSLAAIESLADIYAATRPDVAIIFGNDQREVFIDEERPAFTIMGAHEFVNLPRTKEQEARLPPGITLADSGHLPDDIVRLPGQPALAEHIANELAGHDVDFQLLTAQVHAPASVAPTSGMPHAYGFIYKQIMRDLGTPHVPIDTNTIVPSCVPDIASCFAFGRLVGESVASWDDPSRVCIIASGGLSHFVVDEEFDRDMLDAMTKNEYQRMLDYGEGYYQAGSSEIRSWIAAGGAMSVADIKGRVIGYEPLYRTPAGTGSSAAFVVWE